MSQREELLLTGNEAVDAVQGLQKIVGGVTDADKKIALLKRRIIVTRIHDLQGKRLSIDAGLVFMRHSEAPSGTLFRFGSGLTFSGELATVSYMLDEDVPIDSLALNFVDPEITNALEGIALADSTGAEQSFMQVSDPVVRTSMLQVPVLAITSCLEQAA